MTRLYIAFRPALCYALLGDITGSKAVIERPVGNVSARDVTSSEAVFKSGLLRDISYFIPAVSLVGCSSSRHALLDALVIRSQLLLQVGLHVSACVAV